MFTLAATDDCCLDHFIRSSSSVGAEQLSCCCRQCVTWPQLSSLVSSVAFQLLAVAALGLFVAQVGVADYWFLAPPHRRLTRSLSLALAIRTRSHWTSVAMLAAECRIWLAVGPAEEVDSVDLPAGTWYRWIDCYLWRLTFIIFNKYIIWIMNRK